MKCPLTLTRVRDREDITWWVAADCLKEECAWWELIHPDVEAYSPEFKQAAQNIRERLLNGFRIMGCTEDEIHDIDTQFA